MAWRFHEHILRGELDNTVRGRVTGRIWLAGIAGPMTLDLRGDCAPDLAGCTFTFENPNPVPFADIAPNLDQRGWNSSIGTSGTRTFCDANGTARRTETSPSRPPTSNSQSPPPRGPSRPILAGVEQDLTKAEAPRRRGRLDLIAWLDEAQREAARWRRHYHACSVGTNTLPAAPHPSLPAKMPSASAPSVGFSICPRKSSPPPDPLAAILERNKHAGEEADD